MFYMNSFVLKSFGIVNYIKKVQLPVDYLQ